jgi:hypothetical protein
MNNNENSNNKYGFYYVINHNLLIDGNISSDDKLLYAFLVNLARADGKTKVGNKYLSNIFKTSTRTIKRRLKALFDNNYIGYVLKGNERIIYIKDIYILNKYKNKKIDVVDYNWLDDKEDD